MRRVALTIDVEQDVPPHTREWRGVREGLPALLELLQAQGVNATFFITGQSLEACSRPIKQIPDIYEVGCHGYEHERFDKLPAPEQFERIRRATELLNQTFGKKVYGFRAPNFRPSPITFKALKQMGYVYDASTAIYKLGPDPRRFGLVRIPNTLPSSFLRLPSWASRRILGLCLTALPFVILDFHVWEVVKMEKGRFDCRFATGPLALERLEEVIKFLIRQGVSFKLMADLAKAIGS